MNMYCGETVGEKGRGRKDEGKNPAFSENFPNKFITCNDPGWLI